MPLKLAPIFSIYLQIDGLNENDVMSYALYPHVAKEFFKFRNTYGPVDKLETRYILRIS